MRLTVIGAPGGRYRYNIPHQFRGSVAPAAEQDERPEVMYKPITVVEVGSRAFIVPVNHYSATWVTDGAPTWTGIVLAYDALTGAFETKRTRYILDYGYEH